MSIPLTGSLVLVGAGKMGGAMLEGWLSSGTDPAKIVVIDPAPPPEIKKLIQDRKLRFNTDVRELRDCGIVVVAVKPQIADEAVAQIASLRSSRPLVVSIVAGKRISFFESHFGADAAIVRSMPNTPAAVGRGITAMSPNRTTAAVDRACALSRTSAASIVPQMADRQTRIGRNFIGDYFLRTGAGWR